MTAQPEQLEGFLLDILNFGSAPTGDITVNGTAVVYSNSFPLRRGCTFGWSVGFTSVGTIDAKVELEQGNSRPATEGASDSSWCVPDNKTTAMFAEISNNAIHNTAYAPNATAFGRLKITGLGSNNAATKLHIAQMYAIKNN